MAFKITATGGDFQNLVITSESITNTILIWISKYRSSGSRNLINRWGWCHFGPKNKKN